MKLFTYWRSQAAFRVRVALRLKGLPIEKVTLDLLKGDQFAADYQKLNPEGVVPTLIDGDGPPLVQSLAILEYLDEKYPQSAAPAEGFACTGACARDRPDGRDGRASLHGAARAQVSRAGAAARRADAREVGAALARSREQRSRGDAGERSAHRQVLRRRSGDGRGHLPRGASDQRQAVRRPRSDRLSERGPHLRDLHGDRRLRRRASAAPAGRACGADLEMRACARSRCLLSRSLGRRRSALRDRADLQADGRRVRLGARRARARGRRSTCWCRRSRLSSRAVWPIA